MSASQSITRESTRASLVFAPLILLLFFSLDGTQMKVETEHEAINICQYLSSIKHYFYLSQHTTKAANEKKNSHLHLVLRVLFFFLYFSFYFVLFMNMKINMR